MVEPLIYKLNDIVEMKKPHACGTNAWRVTRVGADIKLICTKCGRGIMMSRFDFNKRLKKILVSAEAE
ncbi:MAG: DUF951 domain-containing protein [Leuconostoc gelidum]|jgi:hypothetical protein|uniref:DUF951 domain-containing protein n=1 Tax=Leuconostoc gelidum subsp. gelidum TaxID=1607839 RepID=A0AB35FXY0_LEUGE|nr:DUF951 domain-containing protein [Leuconostoc gelidum]AFS40995.1 hypothetical protein C269_07790 [Leuconostoc gelidum JB7]MBZ5964220.1 DUF951 domain-containing protein [Leuconostoc gelidum subsp. gelidum]MBZ5975739.1 DUF951 domain-containing protein [Leuconostoc gelidum subsp. gelidum]MBZ5976782.1 DUF951 domain-containing protein [Leuconostoc gelidum subsp. gelidum]MBZ5979066.1 DUF951 domain-containing protein [Leuconostoc gelidum subsp. gelidum]